MKNLLGLFVLPLLVVAAHAKLNVVVTTPDLASIAREIGGDQIELTALARPTEDPHFVDAKPSFIVKLNKAGVLLEGGAELEIGWLPPLLQGARNPKIQSGTPGYVLCNEGITMLEVPATLDRSKGDVHASGNPHFMSDPANGKIVAKHIASAFCQLDPKSCDVFKANLISFENRLDAKLSEWRKLLAPHKGKEVVTYHNYWIYFAKAFDLKMDLYLEPKPGIPPTPAHLAGASGRSHRENEIGQHKVDRRAALPKPEDRRNSGEPHRRRGAGLAVLSHDEQGNPKLPRLDGFPREVAGEKF